jgi:serine/threonine-protein kinase
VTVDPTETLLPTEQETPILVCMQQTGQTRRQCRLGIRRGSTRYHRIGTPLPLQA